MPRRESARRSPATGAGAHFLRLLNGEDDDDPNATPVEAFRRRMNIEHEEPAPLRARVGGLFRTRLDFGVVGLAELEAGRELSPLETFKAGMHG